MAYTPWLTSDKLIESIKRKIAVPLSQVTFSEDDILAFCNEELQISLVPSILSFNEEYFVYDEKIPLESNKNRYPIPTRAIGMKLRDVMWESTGGTIYEMTRIEASDKAFFQNDQGTNGGPHKFYLENNDVVLNFQSLSAPSGSLVLFYYRRPNQLVVDSRAAIINNFVYDLTVDNALIAAGDVLTINSVDFEAVSSAPTGNQFLIGASSIETATNLVTSINANGIVSASNGNPSSDEITVVSSSRTLDISVTGTGLIFASDTIGLNFDSIPENITNSSIVDILQTKPGHKFYGIDVQLSSSAISDTVIRFSADDISDDIVIGDYVCLANECIIPQIPPDLHNGLAERAALRVLSSLGDQQGMQASQQKIAEIEKAQGLLVDSRVDGSPEKILNRYSPLRVFRTGNRRRF